MDDLNFIGIPLNFAAEARADVFSLKNNKTLAQTIDDGPYKHLSLEVVESYEMDLNTPLGSFLLRIKGQGDPFYRRFLNKYGDLEYINFKPNLGRYGQMRGLYCYKVAGELRYLGRATTTFRSRISSGYGTISPKKCYLDGRDTECLINALIRLHGGAVTLQVCPMNVDTEEICRVEQRLISELNPEWNGQGTTHRRKGILSHFAHLGY